MGFLGFGGGNATVQLLLDRQEVSAGGTLQATVRVAGGRKDAQIDEGRLRLVCENEYEWREETTSFSSGSSSSTSSTSTRRDTDRKVVQEERFLEPGAVAADTPSDHTLTVEIAARSPPSADGNITRVRWKVQAIVAGEVELTPGLPVEYPFRLEVPPDPVPTLETEQSTVRWRLKGIGSRRMRRDYDVAQELYVYSAPGTHLG